MKLSRWYLFLAALLAAISFSFYLAQVLIFHKPHDTFFYMLQDLAFVPIQVLLVTLILNDLMVRREKKALLNKMNMVIGAFFSEMGNELITSLTKYDPVFNDLAAVARPGPGWKAEDFALARRRLEEKEFQIDARRADLGALKDFLSGKRGFVLGLLENQNLLEHATFTDLLWAVTHLTEELQFRTSLKGLPPADCQHLSGDIKRVYGLLLGEWLGYARHLKEAYPYMYSLVVRHNPFDPEASVTIK
ncbi:hypothetical protein HZA73_00735 [candidate division TA06 bacterium]|nr:hypothetical protein [candidate division TA06 bacterium]